MMLPFEIDEIKPGMQALRPLNIGGLKNFNYATFDIETNNWTDFELLGFYDGHKYMTFPSVNDFLSYAMTKKYRFWRFFAHAGGRFDFNFIVESLDHDFPKVKYEILSSQGISQLKVWRDEKQVWIFKDSYKVLPMSLNRLCQTFDTLHKKLEIDYSRMDKDDLMMQKYLENDCKGLYEVIQKYGEWVSKYNVPLEGTIASQSMMMYRRTMERPIQVLKPVVEKFVRESYHGGRVEIFKMISHKPLKYYDINSLYPFVMVNNEMPIGKGWYSDHYVSGYIGFYKAEIKMPDVYVPILPMYNRMKLLFPTGNMTGYYSSKELELAEKIGGEVKILYGYVFSSKDIFGSYIYDMYDKKKNAKDQTTRYLAKLLMNSNYGKWGQARLKEKIVKCTDMSQATGMKPYMIDQGLFTQENTSKAAFIIPSIASWITSCARVELFNLLSRIGNKHIWYADTDSCMCDIDIAVSNEMGGAKMEEECDEAIFLLPKLYAMKKGDNVLIKAKGFDKKFIDNLSFHSFEKALDGDVSDFKQQLRKFATMKESLRRNGTFVSMVSKTKSIKSRYDKRKIIEEYDTVPWRF